jgi:hypothetical protein
VFGDSREVPHHTEVEIDRAGHAPSVAADVVSCPSGIGPIGMGLGHPRDDARTVET